MTTETPRSEQIPVPENIFLREQGQADAALIAHYRNRTLLLATQLDAARAEITALKSAPAVTTEKKGKANG